MWPRQKLPTSPSKTSERQTSERQASNLRTVGRSTELDIHLDRSSPIPLYHQLARELERSIAEGPLVKGAFLGNEIDLSESWQLSRLTVRRAIQELVDSGLLVRQRGVGTQVVNDELPKPPRLGSLYDDLAHEGRNPTTTVIMHERVVADAVVSDELGLPRGSIVIHVERCRYADGRRLAILRNWLTVEAAGDLTTEELAANGLYHLLRSRGVWPHYAMRHIGARVANPTDAALLGLSVGAPLLTVRSVMQDTSGTRVEVGEHVHDASNYTMDSAVVDS